MDASEPDKSKPELSDSWMVISDSSADQENPGGPTDGSDGESVEVIDQEEYEEGLHIALVEGTDYETIPPGQECTSSKTKKYVHHPNNDVNAALNKLMIIAATIVVGLAVGHYLGYSEEVADVTTALKKLKAENTILKNQICKLFENYVGHNTESPDTKLKQADNYSLYHMILLDIKCPVLEAQMGGIKEDLNELRQAYAKGHLAEDELQGRIDKLLQNTTQSAVGISDQSSSKSLHSEGEPVILPGDRLVDIASAVERSEHSTKINLDSEASGSQKTVESDFSFKSHELPSDNTFENLFENVPTQGDDTIKIAGSEASNKNTIYDVLTETTVDFKGTDGCLSSSESRNYLCKLETLTENMLKHIVKDMVQEMTESLLVSHHQNIIKDIRDETKILVQSVPVFKSALLLNMEVISKLKSNVRYMKNTFKSFLDHSHDSTQQEKLTSILNDVNKHTLSLEKAMTSLQLLEAVLNQNRGFALKSDQDKTCTATEFFEKFYVNTFLITEDTKKHSFPNHEEKTGNYFINPKKENSMITERNSLSNSNSLDDTSIKDIPHKSKAEKNSGELVQKTGAIKQEENNAIRLDGYTRHELPSKPKEKLLPGYQVPKGNLDTDKFTGTNKHTEPEIHPNDDNSYNREYSNNKHSVKYPSSKKTKENKKEHKENKEKHYNKHEKKFKRDLHYAKNKHVGHSTSWVGNDNERRNSNVSGEWVINLNRGRAESRDAEHRSDWLFDRASARKVKRSGKWDMSNWYFERAESRNYCRHKSNNGKNKVNCSPEHRGKQFHGKESKKFSKFRKYFKPKNWSSKAYMAVSKFKF